MFNFSIPLTFVFSCDILALVKKLTFEKQHLTAKRKQFAELVAKTGDVQAATLKVYGGTYPSAALKRGEEITSLPVVARKVISIWNKMGLTLDVASKKHLEVLKSKQTKKGDVLKAIEMVYKGHGVYKEGEESKASDQNFLMLFIKQRKERGLPVPKKIIEMVEEKKEIK